MQSERDTSNFDPYPDSEEDLGEALSGDEERVLSSMLTKAML